MHASHELYATARARVLEARDVLSAAELDDNAGSAAHERLRARVVAGLREDLAAAHDELRKAEESVQADFDRAWEANRQAVLDAADRYRDALRRQVHVQTEVGTLARDRWLAAGGAGMCFLLPDEKARADEARAATEQARAVLAAAKAAFKDGVTAEQLATPVGPGSVEPVQVGVG